MEKQRLATSVVEAKNPSSLRVKFDCGLNDNGKTIVKKCNFSGDRNEVRTLATNYAINMMIKELKDNNYE